MDEPKPRRFKTGVKRGAGPPPGYRWSVDVLDQAFQEARAFLDSEQYEHLAAQFRELARHDAPTQSSTIDVRSIDEFFELRDKGGVLGKINVRVFFLSTKRRVPSWCSARSRRNKRGKRQRESS